MKKRVFVMVGTPASGKSYYVSKQKNATAISRDAIRFALLSPEDDYFSKEDAVWAEFIRQIKKAIAAKSENDIYIDATHMIPASRKKLFKALGSSLVGIKVIAVVVQATVKKCLEQNEHRSGRAYVPKEQIKRLCAQYVKPEIEEGFDEIWTVREGRVYVETKEGV